MPQMKSQSHKQKPQTVAVSPARRAAFDILYRVESEAAFASVLLAAQTALSREDHALAQELTLGVLRHRKTLDAWAQQYTRRPLAKLDLPVLLALRLGLYQLRYLTRIPPSAAVNESVNLVKLARKASAAPLVNAALRAALRNPNDNPTAGAEDELERLAIEVSHPRWLLARWQRAFGEDQARQLAAANNQTPPVAFRVNTRRTTREEIINALSKEGVSVEASKIADGALVITRGAAALLTRFVEAGLVYVQDEASQLVALLLDAKSEHRILDLCAAPGSKTSQLGVLTEDRAHIIAGDLHAQRLATLAMNCQRLGLCSVDVVAFDATAPLPFLESAPPFDRVLVDAPCTGTGTLRRHPEIKWRLEATDIGRLAEVQAALIARAARALAVGGRLVYSTCSVEREENEDVVEGFLGSHAGFHLVPANAPAHCLTSEGFARTFPHRHNTDGFFAAVLEKVS